MTSWIQLCDIQRISHKASGGGAAPRTDHDIMIPCIFDKVPHDQEIIHISHVFDRSELKLQSFLQLRRDRMIAFLQSFITELVQIFPGGIPLRYVESGKLRHAEFDLHVAPLCDFVGVFQRFQGIREQLGHLFRRLDIVLSALVPHPVLIRQLFAGLQAQKDVMRLPVLGVRIVAVVGRHQIDPGLLVHAQELLVDDLLLRDPVILHFQEKIAFSENALITERRLLTFLIHTPGKVAGDFPRQAG